MHLLKIFVEKRLWLWYGIAVVVILLDQLTKNIAVSQLVYNRPVEITGFFNFTLRYNTGAAFSMFADGGGWQRWFLGVLAAGVSVGIIVWIARLDRKHWIEALGLALVLGGALGNLYDRILLGHVVDFLHFHYMDRHHFPAFNIADAAITCGAGLLIFDALFLKRESRKNSAEKQA